MPAPTNQTCLTAITITSLPFTAVIDTTLAGNSPSSPDSTCGSGFSYNSVWYKWTCPVGVSTVYISSSDVSTYTDTVSIFTGTCGALVDTGLCTGDNAGSFPYNLPVTSGTTYFFLLTSYLPGGCPTFTFTLQTIETVGDTCATARVITSIPFNITMNTTTNGDSPTTPDTGCGSGNSYNSAWFKWVCPAGLTTVALTVMEGPFSYNTVWSMYSGADCSVLVATGDCGYSAYQNTFSTVPGTTYWFLFTSYDPGGDEEVQFILEEPQPFGDFCIVLNCDVPPTPPVVSSIAPSNSIPGEPCDTITITGTDLPSPATLVVKGPGDVIATYTVVSSSSTVIKINNLVPAYSNGQYCVAFGTPPITTWLQCSTISCTINISTGIYFLDPAATKDTLYLTYIPPTTQGVKIP